MNQVLLIDDDTELVGMFSEYLEQEGFRVACAHDGETGAREALSGQYAIAILDVMMPRMNGIETLRRIRAASRIPVLMLTGRGDDADRILGLELGADDYVTKPYSARELIARIRAVLRRGSDSDDSGIGDGILEAGPVRMDVERHVVSVNGEAITLPLKEFDLLEYLMRNSGRVLTRGQLIDRVWGADYVGDTKTLDVHVKRLRSKIEADPANPVHLVTVRGLGYKLEG